MSSDAGILFATYEKILRLGDLKEKKIYIKYFNQKFTPLALTFFAFYAMDNWETLSYTSTFSILTFDKTQLWT